MCVVAEDSKNKREGFQPILRIGLRPQCGLHSSEAEQEMFLRWTEVAKGQRDHFCSCGLIAVSRASRGGELGAWWRTPLIPALGRQRQADFWVRGLQSEFQDSQGYTEKPSLEKPKTNQPNKHITPLQGEALAFVLSVSFLSQWQ